MTTEEFKETLKDNNPLEGTSELLKALWYDANGNWEMSHDIAQSINGKNGAWVHAYLHRVEGDIGNANYWYSMAGKTMPPGTLEEEWEDIVSALL
jgi:hypothetical protein